MIWLFIGGGILCVVLGWIIGELIYDLWRA